MRLLSKELTFYLYLKVTAKEDWAKCVDEVIRRAQRQGLRYTTAEYGNFRKEPCDIYDDGSMGAPMLFKGVNNPIKI